LFHKNFARLEEEIARMKKNQERRLHRKNAKIVKEGGTPMQLNRPVKPDTTVCTFTQVLHLALDSPITETMWSLWADGSHE
jgi:transcription initiation factor TFIID subunit 1